MKTKILHIVNGDCTKDILKASNLDGDIAVWREMLCEGPVSEIVGSKSFYEQREKYLASILQSKRLNYSDLSVKEFKKIENSSNYNEVILWFEYDLFCQINLIACCSLLLQNYAEPTKYYLICVGKVEGKEGLMNLSQFKSEEYPALFSSKEKLLMTDLQYADGIWRQYCKKEFDLPVEVVITGNSKFPYLQLALFQHAKRFNKMDEDFNQIETKILTLIKSGWTSNNQLIIKLLEWQEKETLYGFGDLQYERYIENVKKKLLE